MTTARAHIVDATQAAAYHCFNRCVRGAMLCGNDRLTGRCLDHRRAWIENRALDLCESFAVSLYAWAVMDNHYHLVLVVDPLLPDTWTDEEVAHRWCRLTQIPGTAKDPQKYDKAVAALLVNPEGLAEKRQRLGSLSWFMRYLNEGIARCANREDGCKGRFWEGRYGCQNLLDETAMLAGMAYADLNPVRAGIADELADSRYTAIHRRLTCLTRDEQQADAPIAPLAGPVITPRLTLTNRQYIELVDWMGRQQKSGKAHIDANAPPALARTRFQSSAWLEFSAGLQRRFAGAVGTRGRLDTRARQVGRSWLRGAQWVGKLKGSPP